MLLMNEFQFKLGSWGEEEDKSIKYSGMIYNKEEIKVKPNQQEIKK